jgi:organic radical activating enzyme
MTTLVEMKNKLIELGMNPDTFCFAPYINVDLDQTGKTYVCCASKNSIGNWKTEKIEDHYNNEVIKNLRNDLFQGVKNKNCQSCWFAENKNSKSTRIDSFNDALEHIENLPEFCKKIKNNIYYSSISNVKRIEIRLSALCNLKCAHCSPAYSTQWINTITNKENFNFFAEYDEFDSKLTYQNVNEFFKTSLTSNSNYENNIKEMLSNTKLIQFSGGEPLLSPEHILWLKYLVYESKTASTQILEYNTNLMIKDIDKFFSLWKNFKRITLRTSIDTDFNSIEYFRANSSKDLLIKNLKKIKDEFNENFDNIGTVTFNMLSALRYKNIMHDWIDNDLNFHCSIVYNHPYSCLELPIELQTKAIAEMQWCKDNIEKYTNNKKFIRRFIKHTDFCLNFLKSHKAKNNISESTINYIKFFDKITNKNILDYFPEFSNYINNFQ